MRPVLWGNVLTHGKVISNGSDHLMLYRHAEKLDAGMVSGVAALADHDVDHAIAERARSSSLARPARFA